METENQNIHIFADTIPNKTLSTISMTNENNGDEILPWNVEQIKNESRGHILIEFDLNQLIKNEIEIGEPKIQLQEASNAQSYSLKRGKYSPTNNKKKKIKQNTAKSQTASFKFEFYSENYSTNLSLIEHNRKLH